MEKDDAKRRQAMENDDGKGRWKRTTVNDNGKRRHVTMPSCGITAAYDPKKGKLIYICRVKSTKIKRSTYEIEAL